MDSSIIQSRSWHEYSGSNEPEQQDATLASSGVKIPVNVKMSASMGSSIIQSRSWHEYSGSNEPEQQPASLALATPPTQPTQASERTIIVTKFPLKFPNRIFPM